MATSPTTTTVFVSMLADDGAVMWADQDSKYFGKCAAPAPYPDDGLLCMVPFAGDVYLTNRQGAVLSTAAAAVVDDDMVPPNSQGRHCGLPLGSEHLHGHCHSGGVVG